MGPGFGDKFFVQFIALDRQDRNRSDVARKWIRILITAIRKHDKRHLITVGLVPWSLDRPGLTSGFVPEKIADDLDFIAMHIYPEKGKVDEAIETVKGFAAVGKPVVIEETFVLKCGADELEDFIDASRTVIGAGSVVTRDIPDSVFAAGNPCRVIRQITEEEHG